MCPYMFIYIKVEMFKCQKFPRLVLAILGMLSGMLCPSSYAQTSSQRVCHSSTLSSMNAAPSEAVLFPTCLPHPSGWGGGTGQKKANEHLCGV